MSSLPQVVLSMALREAGLRGRGQARRQLPGAQVAVAAMAASAATALAALQGTRTLAPGVRMMPSAPPLALAVADVVPLVALACR